VHGQINCKIVEAQRCPTQKYWKIWQNVEFCAISTRERKTHTHIHTILCYTCEYVSHVCFAACATWRMPWGTINPNFRTQLSSTNGRNSLLTTLHPSNDALIQLLSIQWQDEGCFCSCSFHDSCFLFLVPRSSSWSS